ncbi:hypothetical protein Tco_1146737 [Tanacetum coccineum]
MRMVPCKKQGKIFHRAFSRICDLKALVPPHEIVEKGIVELFFIGIEYQLADLFSKALSEDRFKYLARRLGMRCLTPDELEVLAIEFA